MTDIRGIHYEISKPKLNMKVMSLPRKVGYFIAVFATAFCLVTVSAANATMTCTWLDEFPVISDPSIQQKLEAHVRALPGLKNYKIRLLQDRYFLVQAEGKFCKDVPHCEYRLLELRECGSKYFCLRGDRHDLAGMVSAELSSRKLGRRLFGLGI
jgi:hypothetical protein